MYGQNGSRGALEQWSFCGLNRDLRLAFNEIFGNRFDNIYSVAQLLNLGQGKLNF